MSIISKWGTVVVSVFVLVIFGIVISLAMLKTIPDSQPMALLLGCVVSLATTVANYWCGSSAGSASKDATIHQALISGASAPATIPAPPQTTQGTGTP